MLPQPVFINVEYIFDRFYELARAIFLYIVSWDFINLIYTVVGLVVVFLITVVLYCLVMLYELKGEGKTDKKELDILANAPPVTGPVSAPMGEVKRNEIWEGIRAKLLSDSPSDWRLAIIEADIYLDWVLDNKGYHGQTLGDKLKQLTPDKLASIQMAWEAHKIRNRIAHEGAAFTLAMPEARRILSYYEIVFRDLEVIE